jgi:hypothetical protein
MSNNRGKVAKVANIASDFSIPLLAPLRALLANWRERDVVAAPL